ncbi:MAG: hypothetical protein UU40_C0007G0043 [Candidatus Uhrbacteria bacterium GW2011_GWD2_41_121]|uniref:Uncharacterized protein n=1 Tax=Candidatus Uhrbacteria bacterium GW2011_GWC1_41_20 TaxID=1618983 RepID=A0A0G0YFU6_9BACT|nr:MAG: hypothetical protein UT52_C0010G0043 [Candidatus Uhrbacteria bacterium GW2011_GWE1_39_46]KKR63900.1 MAG: hypothetical protein UU04_C0009G0009 [Candidatus Uhrbacteria bacterium GW2011_GWC2_40_450]KKR89672.1 MAG: hypothetical protein UU36_C0020G0009 [Candidatus Uhrbacteria bacterium GW2011_GWE2_41_1153]KKR90188.1 MAG: hypothetical protein UU40_C0007G0043 [Candidatus Uhrbacteria bacterium GW2011_GWD2_41_121]KKR96109.1 MAG: hypothetical protein UU46_C0007G0008 [Candidatus Uhrbacteria bacter
MSTTTMRYYKLTLAYLPSRFDRQAREAGKYIRTQISRRKIKQFLRIATTSLNLQ